MCQDCSLLLFILMPILITQYPLLFLSPQVAKGPAPPPISKSTARKLASIQSQKARTIERTKALQTLAYVELHSLEP